ncbi:hypothetical protein VIBNISO65_740029 [Vibrio nigripulchritudo SO65]|nr:hypothetical protein VIBNIFTn2_570015 [Vibrio nigripulchritudo FTn2]CCN78752.1 hypothetical protein VIBNISO65_740029 [Vibrio nigripulchritudo SO65]
MVNHAVFISPFRLSTRTLLIMTSFRLHNAHIATSQFLHADKTVTLRIAFLGFFATGAAKDVARMSQGDRLTYKGV